MLLTMKDKLYFTCRMFCDNQPLKSAEVHEAASCFIHLSPEKPYCKEDM